MKLFLICALLPALALARAGINLSEDEFEKKFHEMTNDKEADWKILKKNEEQIEKDNADPSHHYKEGLNEFSDLTEEEFIKGKEGMTMPKKEEEEEYEDGKDRKEEYEEDYEEYKEDEDFNPEDYKEDYQEYDEDYEEYEEYEDAKDRKEEGEDFDKKKDEDRSYSMGLLMPKNVDDLYDEESDKYIKQLMLSRSSVPDSYDGVAAGLVTPVRNQQSCGSCAAFASMAVIETCMIKAGASPNIDLAEQHILECGYNGQSMNGCNGAYPTAYIGWLKDNQGEVPHEYSDPYQSAETDNQCNNAPLYHAGSRVVQAITSYRTNEDEMKTLVYEHGAVVAAIYASDRGLKQYTSGVFNGCTSSQINHAVVIVGYGRENGMDYWKIKNSWGNRWGDNGFFKLQRGVGMCGIGGVVATASCAAAGSADPLPTTTAPPPPPPNMVCDLSTGMYAQYHPLNVRRTRFTTRTSQGTFVSIIDCENSVCTPTVQEGVSNACQYICGRNSC